MTAVYFPHVMRADQVRAEDAAALARAMFDAGHAEDDCPYPQDSQAAQSWRRQFAACGARQGERR